MHIQVRLSKYTFIRVYDILNPENHKPESIEGVRDMFKVMQNNPREFYPKTALQTVIVKAMMVFALMIVK